MNLLRICALTALLLAAAAFPAPAAETFVYDLIPGKNALRYADFVGENIREMYAGLSGRLAFEVHDDNTITSTLFDLTIEGPFFGGSQQPIDWAPFAPGDKLADYLAIDFANTGGLVITGQSVNGQPGSQSAYVGPDISGDPSGVVLGPSNYQIHKLAASQSLMFFDAQARAEIGGTFSVFPPGESPPPGPDGWVHLILLLRPNVERIPEPAATILLIVSLAGLLARSRR